MYKIKVFVTLRESILDPQGTAVKGGLHKLGFEEVQAVRIGKMIELTTDRVDNIEARVAQYCGKLLANVVMEDYTYEIEETP